MAKNEKKIISGIGIGVLLLLIFTHPEEAAACFDYVWKLLLPILTGLVLAFVLNVPITKLENFLTEKTAGLKRRPKEKLLHFLSILIVLLLVGLILVLLSTLVIPELIRTLKSIGLTIQEHWPGWLLWLEKQGIDTSSIKAWAVSPDFQNLLAKVTQHVGSLIGSIANITTSTISTLVSFCIGSVIALHILISKKTLYRHTRKLIYAYLPTRTADRIFRICHLIQMAYTKFLTGQCVEAVILGLLIFAAFSVFRLPYAGLVGTVTAICALIPYIGAFISCILGVLLALLVSPKKALICLVVYLVVQFVENQFIYPHVVGGSVGLSPLWTLIAVLVGGKLFGLFGMIFFIPLVSVGHTLIEEDVKSRLEKKKKEAANPETLP